VAEGAGGGVGVGHGLRFMRSCGLTSDHLSDLRRRNLRRPGG
jgi:hypothetical protein